MSPSNIFDFCLRFFVRGCIFRKPNAKVYENPQSKSAHHFMASALNLLHHSLFLKSVYIHKSCEYFHVNNYILLEPEGFTAAAHHAAPRSTKRDFISFVYFLNQSGCTQIKIDVAESQSHRQKSFVLYLVTFEPTAKTSTH